MTIRAVYRNKHGQPLHAVPLGDGIHEIFDREEGMSNPPFQVEGNKVTFAKYPSEVRDRKPFTGAVFEPADEEKIFEGKDRRSSGSLVTFSIERQDRPLDMGSEFGVPNRHRYTVRERR